MPVRTSICPQHLAIDPIEEAADDLIVEDDPDSKLKAGSRCMRRPLSLRRSVEAGKGIPLNSESPNSSRSVTSIPGLVKEQFSRKYLNVLHPLN